MNNNLISITQSIIVEGKYDKIKLTSLLNANIIETNGFNIFKNKQKLEFIKLLAVKTGIIIMTDSDAAGFKIRNYIKSTVKSGDIYHIYIPDVYGKESRKLSYSKEGKLGVEGLNKDLLIKIFENLNINLVNSQIKYNNCISMIDLYNDGFIGFKNSKSKRLKLLKTFDLPMHLSTSMLIKALNSISSYDEYKKISTMINKS